MSITIKQLINIIRESIDEMPGFHGSGADFDRFNHKKHLGSGCGSQAFGWGTYVTDDRAIGDSYAENALELNDIPDYSFKDGEQIWGALSIAKKLDIPYNEADKIYNFVCDDYDRIDSVINNLTNSINNSADNDVDKSLVEEWKKWVSDLERLKSIIVKNDKSDVKSYLYHVDIPDNTGNNYLEWNEPLDDSLMKRVLLGLTRLPKKYLNMVAKHDMIFSNTMYRYINGEHYQEIVDRMVRDKDYSSFFGDNGYTFDRSEKDGRNLYRKLTSLFGSEKAASLFLLNCCGVQGIAYDAGTMWNKPEGASDNARNYVLFDINGPQITNKETKSMA